MLNAKKLAMVVVLLAVASASPADVIVAWDGFHDTSVQYDVDTTGKLLPGTRTVLSCAGDLTSWGEPRYFVHSEGSGTLVAYAVSDAANCSNGIVLLDDPWLTVWVPKWSPDGTRLAFRGMSFDTVGQRVDDGIYVADVTWGADGTPESVANARLVIDGNPDHPDAYGEVGYPMWSGDNQRITFQALSSVPSSNNSTYFRPDIFVANVDTGEVINVTDTRDESESSPAFSPVANEVVYTRINWDSVNLRKDIYKLSLTTGKETPLTSKKNSAVGQNYNPDWSPNGAYVVFSGERNQSAGYHRALYRVSANGGKLTEISPKNEEDLSGPMWRR